MDDLTLSCVAATGFTPATFSTKNPTTVPANGVYAFNPVGSSDAVFPQVGRDLVMSLLVQLAIW